MALLGARAAFGQNRDQDSLLGVIKTGSPKERTDALNALCSAIYDSNAPLAKQYVSRAIALSDSIGYTEGNGRAWLRLGIVHDVSGSYDSSIVCYNKALVIAQGIRNYKMIGSAYNNLGLISNRRAQYDHALDFFTKALPCFEKIGNTEMIANVYNNISIVYGKTKNYKMAIASDHKALAYYRELNDEENIGGTYTNLSVNYSYMDKYDSAIFYIQKAIQCHQKANNKYGLGTAYHNYGTILTDLKQHELARDYYFKSIALKEEESEYEGLATAYISLSSDYLQQGDNRNSFRYAHKAFAVSRQNNLQHEVIVSSERLADFYAKTFKNADSVYYFLSLLNATKDSVYTQDLRQSLSDAEARYKTKEKELTIHKQQYQLERKNYYIAGLACLILFTVFLFYAFYNRYKLRQKNRLQQEIIRQQDLATKAVINAEENERRRVASDLHDSVGQMLSAVKLNLSTFGPEVAPANTPRFEKIMDMVDESCREVRAISHNMMPNSLLKNGLVSAIREFIGQLSHASLIINIETAGLHERLDDNTETVLYRVVQECVNNVIKHAQASRLDINIARDAEGISITIEDNGLGFDTSLSRDGIGLKNLRSRIHFLKGSVDISSAKNKGTLIALFIPEQNKP